jgi:hypothetical protein
MLPWRKRIERMIDGWGLCVSCYERDPKGKKGQSGDKPESQE